tara:strand:+ start:1756 stop:1953 length:198 start_codon:yes stop_codon:yes gene_type:complete
MNNNEQFNNMSKDEKIICLLEEVKILTETLNEHFIHYNILKEKNVELEDMIDFKDAQLEDIILNS